jgi:predicted HD phosphohydrolase
LGIAEKSARLPTYDERMSSLDHSAPRATFTKFEDSTQEEWAEIIRQLPITQALAGQNVIDQLRLLERDHGGFPVSRLEHSLQTATRAEEDGRGEEYVLCALIHDIGDTLAPYNHPSIAAGLLKPFVSEANHWMVEHHGIFQGYYFWHFIGADRNARDAYRDSPYYEYTEEFCAKYDQTAFDPEYTNAPLAHYEPLIRKYLVPKELADSYNAFDR